MNYGEHPTSFRDPSGALCQVNGRIYRTVLPRGVEDFQAFLGSAAAQTLFATERLPPTRILSIAEKREIPELSRTPGDGLVLEHERVSFPSYPMEWPAEMLHAAALFTLDLAESLLPESLGLKDATPFNILWKGVAPVFVDLLSFERRHPADPTWLPLAQFQRTFLFPLVANSFFGVTPDQIFFSRGDGLEPEELYRWAGALLRLRPPFLSEVSLPVWLGRRQQKKGSDFTLYERHLSGSPAKARYILQALWKRQRRLLEWWKPVHKRKSMWSGYEENRTHYQPEQMAAKENFIQETLAETRPQRVLDIGCNTGYFSALAARAGASVVAIDGDAAVVGQAWTRAHASGLPVLPLTVNLARPTPAIGWRNRETASFLERACGFFDCVFMLAVIHHLVVTERVPLEEIIRLVAELTTAYAVIEFVGAEDPMFRRITRGREHLHQEYTQSCFEQCCRRYFEVVRHCSLLPAHRSMYLLRKRL